MSKSKGKSLSGVVSLPEHPSGKAYMEECRARASARTKEASLAILNKVRASCGKPPLSLEEAFNA